MMPKAAIPWTTSTARTHDVPSAKATTPVTAAAVRKSSSIRFVIRSAMVAAQCMGRFDSPRTYRWRVGVIPDCYRVVGAV